MFLASDAGADEFYAIREALYLQDNGTIDLTIIGVETIPNRAFYDMYELKSVTCIYIK